MTTSPTVGSVQTHTHSQRPHGAIEPFTAEWLMFSWSIWERGTTFSSLTSWPTVAL